MAKKKQLSMKAFEVLLTKVLKDIASKRWPGIHSRKGTSVVWCGCGHPAMVNDNHCYDCNAK